MNLTRAMRFPWAGRDVPHAILDVGRGCDMVCPQCYNGRNGGFKSLEQLDANLSALRRRRRLQTVSLTGGEPSLHPHIVEIVRLISRAGIKAAMLTNGLQLKPELLARLRDAGLKAVLLHIQPGQWRADIPENAAPSEWCALRAHKARLIFDCGMKAGLTWIGYRGRLNDVADAVEEVLDSPHLDYLLVTGCRDFRRFEHVQGSVDNSLRGISGINGENSFRDDEVTMEYLQPLVGRLGFPPFGRVASNRDASKARWLTHLIAVTEAPDGRRFRAGIKPALSDRLFSRALRLASGRNIFLFTPTHWQFRLQLAFNSVSGGDFATDWKVIFKSLAGHRLFDKHILFQEGPTLLSNGEIEFCDNCPDAVWQDDALVPVCLTDRMALAKPKNTP